MNHKNNDSRQPSDKLQSILQELAKNTNIQRRIELCRKALNILKRDVNPRLWASLQNDLGDSLQRTFQGRRADNIEEAVRCCEQALEVRGRDAMPAEWAATMMNLANAYSCRIRGDRAENIEEAIRCYEQALEVRTRDAMPVKWAIAMINLGVAYSDRIRGDRADNIEEAIRCYEQVLEVITRAMPAEWAGTMMNLGAAYFDRVRGNCADNIEEAIRCYEHALEVRTRDAMPVEWAEARLNLANAYSSRIRGDRSGNIKTAILFYEQVLDVMTRDAMPSDHRRAQRNLGDLCMNENFRTKATKAFAGVLAANEILYKSSALPESRQSELREIRGIAARSAYALEKNATLEAMPGNRREAVEVLERNRARWLSEALSLRTGKPKTVPDTVWNDFDTRRQDHSQLLAESRLPENTPGRRTFLELGAAMRKASEMLNAALAKVCEHESSFMPDPDFELIRSSVSYPGEALIYFAVTSVGSVAFIVRPEGESVEHIRLDSLLEETLDDKIQNYLDAYEKWRENPDNSKACATWFDILDSTLNQLWDWLMGPLTERLAESGSTRAILIPQGLLGLLPMHAAWTNANGKRRYALDDVCYTYAPNALSLIRSRDIAKQTQPERLLAIEEPFPVNAAPLPNANAEVTAICRHFPETQKVLADAMATKTAVRDALPKYQVFHFSCHGMADFNEPLNSGLLMSENDILRLRDFLSMELKGARLAVLSACETGIPDIENADEAISLPAGLVQAGVAGVAASLWSVSDISTMILMIRFYEFWRIGNLEPAEALRQAQIWVKDTTNGQKAAYFRNFLPEFGRSDNQRLPVCLVDMLYKRFVFENPDENDFEHPFYWAAFGYTGV